MSGDYLLDTNIIIALFGGDASIINRLNAAKLGPLCRPTFSRLN
jgi:hypothetical protein